MDTATREKAPRAEDSCAPTPPDEASKMELAIEVDVGSEVSDVPPSMWSLVASHVDTGRDTDTEDPSLSPFEVEGDAMATGVGQIDPIRSHVTRRLVVAAIVVVSLSAVLALAYLIG
jgi:hypothetical protein